MARRSGDLTLKSRGRLVNLQKGIKLQTVATVHSSAPHDDEIHGVSAMHASVRITFDNQSRYDEYMPIHGF